MGMSRPLEVGQQIAGALKVTESASAPAPSLRVRKRCMADAQADAAKDCSGSAALIDEGLLPESELS